MQFCNYCYKKLDDRHFVVRYFGSTKHYYNSGKFCDCVCSNMYMDKMEVRYADIGYNLRGVQEKNTR